MFPHVLLRIIMITTMQQSLRSRGNRGMSSPYKNDKRLLSDKVLPMCENDYSLKFPETSQEKMCVGTQCLKTLLKHLLPCWTNRDNKSAS